MSIKQNLCIAASFLLMCTIHCERRGRESDKHSQKAQTEVHKAHDLEYAMRHWVWKVTGIVKSKVNRGRFYSEQFTELENDFPAKVALYFDPTSMKFAPVAEKRFKGIDAVLLTKLKEDLFNNIIYTNKSLTWKKKGNTFKIHKDDYKNYSKCVEALEKYANEKYNNGSDIDRLRSDISERIEQFIFRTIFYDIYLCINFDSESDRLKYGKVMDIIDSKIYYSMKDNGFLYNPYIISPEILNSLDNGLMRAIYVYTALEFRTQERELFNLEARNMRRNTNKTDKLLKCTTPKSIGYAQFQLVLYEAKKYLSKNGVPVRDATERGCYGLDNYLKIVTERNKKLKDYGLETLIKEKGTKLHALTQAGEIESSD